MRLPTFIPILATGLLLPIAFIGCHVRQTTDPVDSWSMNHEVSILEAALDSEPIHLSRAQQRVVIDVVRDQTRAIRAQLPEPHTSEQTFGALQRWFFSEAGFKAIADLTRPEATSVASTINNGRGTCMGLTIVYLEFARLLALDAHAVATPAHLFVRVRLNGQVRNVELLAGGLAVDDDDYRRRYKIDDASIISAAFMADLTNDQVIAHLLSNQAVALSKQGKLDEALTRYDKALRLHPKLVAAWYNRGIDLMNVGRLKEALDSFNRSLELYPSDAQAHNNRGLVKARMGDPDGARADFERALQLDPAMKEAEENLKRLLTP